MDGKCSLSQRVGDDCRESRGVKEIVKLADCQSDISGHLSRCHLSKTGLKECDLILLRAGLFNLANAHVQSMTVCPKHRHELGRFWRPSKNCQYPKHSGGKTVCQGRHVVNPRLSDEVMKLYGQLVQVGSRKYLSL